ncbi:MAG: type III pantothenate kinase [Pirellulales bacterium]|nr:type III pantothenate kinase [Pirellulales bacterium]
MPSTAPLIAVDIGNSRMKFGLFVDAAARAKSTAQTSPLPEPARTLYLAQHDGDVEQLHGWLDDFAVADADWWIASVNRPAATRLIDWLRDQRATPRTRLLYSGDLPLAVELPRPDMVGIDRLLGAVAANALREPSRPAAIVHLGSAITVNFVSASGAFCGGAILPGIAMSARALHEFTDLLPLVELEQLADPPSALGTSTPHAIESGVFWGAIGAARELIARLGNDTAVAPQVFLTGGAAASVASLLAPDASYLPHLVLSGVALAVRQLDQAQR